MCLATFKVTFKVSTCVVAKLLLANVFLHAFFFQHDKKLTKIQVEESLTIHL